MAKSRSPVRLDEDLMADAAISGKLHSRSAAETIEYWASIGQKVSKILDPETLLDIQAGAVSLEIKKQTVTHVDPDDLFSGIEASREAGTLTAPPHQKPIYQASKTHPGKLEQLMPNGEINIGQFKNGKFTQVKT